jgi:hypothetical protein
VCAPDCAGHARPCLLEGQHTLDIVTENFFTRDGVDDSRLDTKEWKGSTAWLGGSDTSERSDNIRAGLGLPVGL